MRRCKSDRGMTLVELLMVMGLVVCLGAMLAPAILASREAARRTTCVNNMKALGLACHKYAQANRALMPSSNVTRDAKGKIVAVDGWSWAVLVLPYMEGGPQRGKRVDLQRLYDSLDIQHGRPLIEPDGAKGTPHADALATSLPGLLCPSSGAGPYADANGKWVAVTSYHPFGATHIESLSVASANPLKPKYGLSANGEGRRRLSTQMRLLPRHEHEVFPSEEGHVEHVVLWRVAGAAVRAVDRRGGSRVCRIAARG